MSQLNRLESALLNDQIARVELLGRQMDQLADELELLELEMSLDLIKKKGA